MISYKLGEAVTIRAWDSMVNEYGLCGNSVDVGLRFSHEMSGVGELSRRGKPTVRTYKVGDMVLIRSFSSMLNEFGANEFGSIETKIYFLRGMESLCGTNKKITHVFSGEDAKVGGGWYVSPDMIVGGGIFRR